MSLDYDGQSEYLEVEPSLSSVNEIKGYTLLEFGAPWCSHCQGAKPYIEQALSDYENLMFFKIYDGKGKPLGRSFNVKLWPTLILVKDGQELNRLVRPANIAEITDLLASMRTP